MHPLQLNNFELHALALCQRWLLLLVFSRKLVPQRQGQGSYKHRINLILFGPGAFY